MLEKNTFKKAHMHLTMKTVKRSTWKTSTTHQREQPAHICSQKKVRDREGDKSMVVYLCTYISLLRMAKNMNLEHLIHKQTLIW